MANGFKVFAVGEVLTAADVNDYLMEQSISIFADSTARDAQITSPIEGMFCYLADTNVLQFYNGSAWANFIGEGDITGITAGDGLSGGGTSGAVSLALDLNELTGATVDVANDSIAIVDATDNSSKKESIADLASAMADGSTITASAGVLSAAGGGGLVKLASATASNSASLTFDNFVDQNTYNSYQIIYKNIKPQNDGANWEVRFREGGASGSTITGTYRRQNWYSSTSSFTLSVFSSTATDKSDIYQLGNSTREELSGISYFYPANGTNGFTYIRTMANFNDPSPTNYAALTSNLLDDATSCTGILFQMSSGNIVSGTIDIYGVKS